MTDAEIVERFAELDQLIDAMDERLRLIARQSAALAVMVEQLVGLDTSLAHLLDHDPDAHRST